MHPILFTLPLPTLEFSLLPALLALVLVGLCVAAYAEWHKTRAMTVFGAALAGTAGYASFALAGERVTLSAVQVPTWGSLVALWLVLAWGLCSRSAERNGLDRRWLGDCFVITTLGALLAARVAYVVSSGGSAPDLDLFALRQGGLSGMAALLGALSSAAWFARHHQVSFWRWLDTSAASLALGAALIRIGCYLEGCDFGVPQGAAAPAWLRAVGSFPRWGDPDQAPVFGAAAWTTQVRRGVLESDAPYSLPVQPVQLYEALAVLLLLGLVWYLEPRRRFHGQVGLTLLFGYAVVRFVFDALRGDFDRGMFGPHLAPAVYLPLGLLLFSTAFAYGPGMSFRRNGLRVASIALSTVPAALAAWWGREFTEPVQLSLTQWLCPPLAFAAAHAWVQQTARVSAGAAPA
ncbi:MAG TPA: prolipoprotein diacylglyceryl transferase family protein [Polyangiaceae bacterium]|nr:prolipoprotein diacylglyceryl transferase family protein [Polyangiaceae bacterium]